MPPRPEKRLDATQPPVRPGDPADAAVTQLIREQGGRLHSLARRFCGNADEADDLVQETFLQAFRKWDQFKGGSDPATWLYTIAARACRRMHRKRSGEPARIAPLTGLFADPTAPVPDLPDEGEESPVDRLLRREAVERVESAIAELPAAYRMPLVLKDVVGLSVDQVAAATGVKPATVKTRLHRARLAVREALAQKLPQRDAPPPAFSKQVCLDLLAAKQDALDRGVRLPVPPAEICQRCAAVFASMDLAFDMCRELGDGPLRADLRKRLEAMVRQSG
jgi:RNA polymerase sigma-70 factor (ECF subfamily)